MSYNVIILAEGFGLRLKSVKNIKNELEISFFSNYLNLVIKVLKFDQPKYKQWAELIFPFKKSS